MSPTTLDNSSPKPIDSKTVPQKLRKDGYISEVKGGGIYGEVWREFLKYPKINELTYPYHDRPGYWLLYETALGTNPKFFKRPDENAVGENSTERNRSGVLHFGHGIRVHHGPDNPEWAKEWVDFTTKNNLPNDHWFHIHNYFATYAEDWVPHIPGINAPGRYADYAKDPWKTVSAMFKKVEDGTYEYFYPAAKAKKR